MKTNVIHQGDAKEVLYELPESSVHMSMTSPPYYGLRDYGHDEQIGLEQTLDKYVQDLVEVGRGLKHCLRDDGSWWLNLGDTYSGGGGAAGKPDDWDDLHDDDNYPDDPPAKVTKFGQKNKMLVPYRVAMALQRDGWIIRNDATWLKLNPMPESVKDRLTTTTEQIFHLVQEPDYWYDLDAIREPHKKSSHKRAEYSFEGNRNWEPWSSSGVTQKTALDPNGKNPGDVFKVTVQPYSEAHFAVYPSELCEKPIKASCPPKVCAECGTGYERDVEVIKTDRSGDRRQRDLPDPDSDSPKTWNEGQVDMTPDKRKVKGWKQSCDCNTQETESGVVLDMFAGAGTTCLMAKALGRDYVGIELKEEYIEMANERIKNDWKDHRDKEELKKAGKLNAASKVEW